MTGSMIISNPSECVDDQSISGNHIKLFEDSKKLLGWDKRQRVMRERNQTLSHGILFL
jgi:hypothetical protein